MIDRIGDVAGPNIGPLLARLEANTIDGAAVVESGIANVRHTVKLRIGYRQRVETVEKVVAAAQVRRSLGFENHSIRIAAVGILQEPIRAPATQMKGPHRHLLISPPDIG